MSIAPSPAGAEVRAHPGATDYAENGIYKLRAAGTAVPVRNEALDFEVAMFSMNSATSVQVTVATGVNLDGFTLKPTRHGIAVQRNGQVLTFTMATPQKLVLQVPGRKPLAILATPFDTPPDCGAANVKCFPIGETNIESDLLFEPASNQTLYLPSGAVVRGCIHIIGKTNVTIRGRGVLDASGCIRRGAVTQTQSVHGIYAKDSSNIRIEGISVRNRARFWTSLFLTSTDITMDHYSTFSREVTTDGIDFDNSQRIRVTNSFVRAGDDGFGIHGYDAGRFGERPFENLTVDNTVIWNTGYGNGIRLGTSMEAQMLRNFLFTRIDVLRYHESGLRSDTTDWAWIQNIRFRDIQIDDPESGSAASPISFQVVNNTDYSSPNDPNKLWSYDDRGNIEDLSFENVNATRGTVTLRGYDNGHKLRNVYFRNVFVGGNAIDSAGDITGNTWVEGLTFGTALTGPIVDTAGTVQAEYAGSYTGRSGGSGNVTRLAQYVFKYTILSNEKGRRLLATAQGDYADYQVYAASTGACTMTIGVLRTATSGQYTVSVNGVARGGTNNLYASGGTAGTISIGGVTLNNGRNSVKLTNVGAGAGGGRELNVDFIRCV